MDIEQLTLEIKKAFENTPYPSNDAISASYDGDEIQEAFSGKHWAEISIELVINYRNNLPHHLTKEGYRFFLPTFMLAILNHPRDADTLHIGLIQSLTPPEYVSRKMNRFLDSIDSRMNLFLDQSKTFSQQEILAILKFLKFYKSEYSQEYLVRELKYVDAAIAFWQGLVEKD